ncbi:exported protein of unknown function [Candidatus Filomicrobium marinum]|uniref:Uncharacterized protein n=2 Tax=Filomicrobium TaxID=119044 RepID=A0A0D6JII8_9HYPH|nr:MULTISPECIES: hypothetical protein [Filomicrobium]MCV0371411.1 hypothetical protein [Filomicrobium sp.]CFX35275.1 exported protein of unknown function [Candidatus Filomicrobium marinum]CPR21814.1 exported protein of unknown function [Candidatus Filomicrobium marinum]SDP51195.1 hypothetical protein SAMN04488061_3241 [Filomicrobium insigne]
MKSVATVAALLVAAIASQPALAQDKKGGEKAVEVAGRPALPTDSAKAVFEMRSEWGTKPSMSTAQPEKSEKK